MSFRINIFFNGESFDTVDDTEMESENETETSVTSMDTSESSDDETVELLDSDSTIVISDDDDLANAETSVIEVPQENSDPVPLKSSDSVEIIEVNPGNDRYRCPVCLIGFHNKITMVIGCGHVLCKDCLDSLASRRITNCPICKRRYRRSAAKTI